MKTKKLTLSALLIALATVLALVSKVIPAPWLQGGSITLASMVPIMIISFIYGSKWGILCGGVYSVVQMITGFYPPPAPSFLSFFLVVFLDYILAFGVIGSADFFYKIMGSKKIAIPISGVIVTFLRLICHIISGILIWNIYAEEGQSVLAYSITYNSSYMIPEMIINAVVLYILSNFKKQNLNK